MEMLAAERGAAQNTLDAYTRDLDAYLAFRREPPRRPERADAKDMQAYLQHLTDEGLAAASRARRLSSVRQFYKFLTAEGIIESRSGVGSDGTESGRGHCRKVLSVAEVDRLIEAAAKRIDGQEGRDLVSRAALPMLD